MNKKPPLPTGKEPIPLREAMQYLPHKDLRSLRTRINKDETWGYMIPGLTPAGNRFFIYPKKLREHLKKVYK